VGGKAKAAEKPKRAAQAPVEKAAPRVDDGRSLDVAMRAVNASLEKKALEPVLLDVRDLASYTDYILIVSGRSDRQVDAIAQGIVEALKERLRPLSREGTRDGQWTLLDFGDVVVHVFYHAMRDYYDLESLWSDAPRVKLDIPDDARARPEDLYEKSIVPAAESK
jgi:ribosome-associated protein